MFIPRAACDYIPYSTLLRTLRSCSSYVSLLSRPVSLQIPHFLVRVLLVVRLAPCSGDAERDRVAGWDRWLLARISKWDRSQQMLVRRLIAEPLRFKTPTGHPQVLTLWGFWISKSFITMLDILCEIATCIPLLHTSLAICLQGGWVNPTRASLLVMWTCFIDLKWHSNVGLV